MGSGVPPLTEDDFKHTPYPSFVRSGMGLRSPQSPLATPDPAKLPSRRHSPLDPDPPVSRKSASPARSTPDVDPADRFQRSARLAAHTIMTTILSVIALLILYALIKGPSNEPVVVVNDTPGCRDADVRVLTPAELATEHWWGTNC